MDRASEVAEYPKLTEGLPFSHFSPPDFSPFPSVFCRRLWYHYKTISPGRLPTLCKYPFPFLLLGGGLPSLLILGLAT